MAAAVDDGGPLRLQVEAHPGAMQDGAVELFRRVAQGRCDAGAPQIGIKLADIDPQRPGTALRAAEQRGQRRVFFGAELGEMNMIDRAAERSALEALAQPPAQRGEMLSAEQTPKTRIHLVVHAGANRRSGSASSLLSRPSQVQRETNTAPMPSRHCSWQIAAPGNSA